MRKLLSMLPFDGSKTYISGILAIASGIIGLVGHFMAPETQYAMDIEAAVTLILGGISVLSVGHKLDKANRQ